MYKIDQRCAAAWGRCVGLQVCSTWGAPERHSYCRMSASRLSSPNDNIMHVYVLSEWSQNSLRSAMNAVTGACSLQLVSALIKSTIQYTDFSNNKVIWNEHITLHPDTILVKVHTLHRIFFKDGMDCRGSCIWCKQIKSSISSAWCRRASSAPDSFSDIFAGKMRSPSTDKPAEAVTND